MIDEWSLDVRVVSDGVCVHCAHDPRKTPKQQREAHDNGSTIRPRPSSSATNQ